MTFAKQGAVMHRREGTGEGARITTFIPVRIVRRKFSKVIMRPDGSTGGGKGASTVDSTIIKALARAVYWQTLLDAGRVASVAELARAEGADKVRMQKTLKLARLAPDIAEAIGRGETPAGLSLEFFIRRDLPLDWNEQRKVIGALRA